jgi:hypothetical protein
MELSFARVGSDDEHLKVSILSLKGKSAAVVVDLVGNMGAISNKKPA